MCFEFFTHRKKVQPIWYILNCPEGNESEILCFCKEKVQKEILEDAFTLSFQQMKRYQGAWHIEQGNMVPHCVFLVTDHKEALEKQILKEFPKSLGCCTERLLSIKKEEQLLLEELCGKNLCMELSKGVIQKGITHVTEGPLKGKENLIIKIDRHKRLAFLKKGLLPGVACIKTGLEITEKTCQ